jgi:hypothetical protein
MIPARQQWAFESLPISPPIAPSASLPTFLLVLVCDFLYSEFVLHACHRPLGGFH